MKTKNELDVLQKIERVDAPPFLLTRIEAKIQAIKADKVSMSWLVSASAAVVALIAFNVSLLTSTSKSQTGNSAEIENVVAGMNLDSSNQLYHD